MKKNCTISLLFLLFACLSINAQVSCDNNVAVYQSDDITVGFPNAFTPNNDGINDCHSLFLNISNDFEQATVSVFDQNDAQIYTATFLGNPNFNWCGTNDNGTLVAPGTYGVYLTVDFTTSPSVLICQDVTVLAYDPINDCIDIAETDYNLPSQYNPSTSAFDDIASGEMLCSLGLSDVIGAERAFSIYPNPSTQLLNIAPLNNASFAWRICDINGKTIAQQNSKVGGNTQLDVSNYVSGIYFLHLEMDDKNYVQKLIIE